MLLDIRYNLERAGRKVEVGTERRAERSRVDGNSSFAPAIVEIKSEKYEHIHIHLPSSGKWGIYVAWFGMNVGWGIYG